MQVNETDDTLISSVDHAFLTILIKVHKLYYLTTNNETYKSKVLSYQGGRFNLQEVYSLINTFLNNLLQNKETTKNDDSIISTDEKDITSKNNNLGLQNLIHTCPKKIKIPNPKQKGLRSTSAINKTQKQPKQPPEQDYKKGNLFKSYMPKKGDTDEYIYAVLQGNSEQKDKILEPIISINQINYSNDINVIAELSSTTLITGSDKGIISALRLDYKTRKFSIFCQKKKAHDDTITSFGVLNKTNILSSSCDTTIKQWQFDFQQLKEIHVYTGHTDYVRKILILDTNIFASCSRDGNIYIWNSNKGKTVANLQEQGEAWQSFEGGAA
jgi:WD40 repeat protein